MVGYETSSQTYKKTIVFRNFYKSLFTEERKTAFKLSEKLVYYKLNTTFTCY